MKKLFIVFALITFFGLLITGCSDKSQAPVEPTDQGSAVNLDKKGPIVHAVQGTAHLRYEGKHISATISAHQYQDGSVDGAYLQNGQNALGDKVQKWNGRVLFLKVYENYGEYNGKMAVIGGIETTGSYAGWYDVFFVIDNSPNGVNQTSYFVMGTPDLAEAETWWNLAPDDLVNLLYGILPVDDGTIHVY